MPKQFNFFDTLEGFRYRQSFIGPGDEKALLEHVKDLPFQEFDFHGYKGKRRVVSFGWRYDYSRGRLQEADEVPEFLLPLREQAASFAEIKTSELQQALVTEYTPGAGIGWHRDKVVFGDVVGISLLAPCVLRFRLKVSDSISPAGKRLRKWQRVNVLAEPRSAYLLTGPVRSMWEHSISHVDTLRYSITFRQIRS